MVDCVNVGIGHQAPQYFVLVYANEPTADGYPITNSLSVTAVVKDTRVKTFAPTGFESRRENWRLIRDESVGH